MYCSNCGKEIPNTSKYCESCGYNVEKSHHTAPKKSKNETVKVILHREKKMSGSVSTMYVYVDNKLVANLKNGETVEFNELYGKHKITLKLATYTTESNVDFSKEYKIIYIDVAMRYGAKNSLNRGRQ